MAKRSTEVLTTRAIGGGRYAVLFRGVETSLQIHRDDRPAYRQRQGWDVVRVCEDGKWPTFLFTSHAKAEALNTIRSIMTAINGETQ